MRCLCALVVCPAGLRGWARWGTPQNAAPDDVSSEQVLMELNPDFSTKGLSAQEITAVVQAWQNGALSRASMLDVFRRGEVLPEGRTNAEEARLIQRSKAGKELRRLQQEGPLKFALGIDGEKVHALAL